MSTNWKSVQLRLRTRTLLFLLAILSFASCFSMENEGVIKETVTRDKWLDDRDAKDSRGVSFHRKLLGRFRNPYTHLNTHRDRPPVAAVTPASSSVPSQRGITSKTRTLHPPRRILSAIHVSAPPPSVSLSKNPSERRSSSSSRVYIVAACIGIVFLILLAAGVFFFKSKSRGSVNPWSMPTCIYFFSR